MHQIVIIPLNNSAPAALIYKIRDHAETQFLNISEMQKGKIDVDVLHAKDDFGIVLSMPINNISYVLLIDLDKQQELGINQNGTKANRS